MRSLSRELILPALRLQVPDRPSAESLPALADLSADEWTTRPDEWVTGQVVRLAVAAVLDARLAQAGPERGLGEDATMAQVAGLFRPHVDLAAQSFRVAVVEAVNAGVPAAVDPMRDALRQVGVTGRDKLWMVALGLDKVPPRGRTEFWNAVKGSVSLTAVLDALTASAHDLSGLDPSELARADALLQAGGRTVAVAIDRPAPSSSSSWLQVPLSLTRRLPWRGSEAAAGPGVALTLSGAGWLQVHDTALSAVGAAMAGIDLGSMPRDRATGPASVLATRLAAARGRTVADVLTSLRAVHPTVLETYGEQVRVESARIAIASVEEDHLAQLWLPTSALAGPLVIGAADLFLGGHASVRGGRPGGRPAERSPGRGPGASGRPPSRSERGRGEAQTGEGRSTEGGPRRGQKRRGGRSGVPRGTAEPTADPGAPAPPPPSPADTAPPAPAPDSAPPASPH